jgi:hypothetical protein
MQGRPPHCSGSTVIRSANLAIRFLSCTSGFGSVVLAPNAGRQLLPEAGATEERRLEAVSCTTLFGAGSGTAYRPRWTLSLSCPLWLLRLLACARLPHRSWGSGLRPRVPLIPGPAGRHQRISRLAWNSITGSIVSPRALATFKLMTNSIFAFVSTGICAGFVPLRILSTRRAACRPEAYVSGP